MSTDELLKQIREALNLEARLRFKMLKQIGFQALAEYKAMTEPTIQDLNNYKEIFIVVSKVPEISSKFRFALSKVILKYLQLLGCKNPEILLKKSATIELNSALIALGDPSYATESPNDIELVNGGKAYFFSTGSDGPFNLQIRVIAAPEPVLTPKEYKNVAASSSMIILSCPSGKMAVGDGIIHPMNNQVEVNVTPGNYKCQVFVFKFPSGGYSFYIVLSKCEEDAVNEEQEILTLEPS